MERLVNVSTEKIVKAAATKLGELEPKPSKELIKQQDNPGYEGNVELLLRGVLSRLLFAKNFKELGEVLSDAAAKVQAGTLEPEQLDQVRGHVIDVATQMGGVEDQKTVQEVEGLFKLGDYVGAAKKLKDVAKKPDSGLLIPTEQTIITDFLDKIKDKAHMSDVELDALAQTYVNEILKPHGELLADVATRNANLEQLMLHEEIRILEAKKDVVMVPAEMKVTIKDTQKVAIAAEVTPATSISVKDREFVLGLVGKAERFGARESKTRSSGRGVPPIVEREWNFERMYAKDVKLVWLRTSGILSKYESEFGTPGLAESKALLEKLRDGARQAMLNANEEALRGSPEDSDVDRGNPRARAMRRGRKPPQQELDFFADKRYALNEDGAMGYESLLRKQVDDLREAGYGDPMGEAGSRTAEHLETLRAQRPELRRLLRFEEGKWKWFGTSREYFDLCREQIYDIQGSLTQENMGNLVFEESAQTYLALMRVDVGEKMELENAKDAITKMLYIDYAVRNMWKSGASVETWQRVASILTRDREEGFFEIMNIGESLRVTDAEGNVIDLGRFTADDIMSLMEMRVEKANGKSRYWKTELASQSSALKTKRLPDYAKAIALRVIEKRELMGLAGQNGGLTKVAADAERAKLQNGEYKFDEKQMRWMLRYGQFLGGATLRDGEYGISEALDGKKMEVADHPLGEFAIKTGPWAVIYYYHYEVTKYGGDAVGNLFLPNVSMLSYARGETLGHFIKKDSKVEAGMMKPSGEYQETGIGANEFFFDGGNIGDADTFSKFWGDVIFDTRTGNIAKTAVHRTVDMIREKGKAKLAKWDSAGKTGFINNMNFTNMELMLGNSMGINNFKIPGESNRDKFEWMINHFDYTFWRKDVMKAKREADWVNKYVAKKYVESYTLLGDFLNAPGLATKVKVRDKIGEYAGGPGMEDWEQKSQTFIDKNNEWHLLGWKTAPGSSGEAVWNEEGAGDFYTVNKEQHYAFEGGLGVPMAHSIQDAKEGFKNPMHFEKQDIDNNFYNGLISRKEWGQQRRKWYAKAYLGDEYSVAGIKIRPGYFPLFTPFFLVRGWWVDKMGLNWEDFKLVFSKNNDETWEKFKKLIKV